mmetsp:Transcript_138555/g.351162  ORF Transcript_138555/g.351162 Transcript_138555/m.351162 type:complete len:262 (-) Transcript_138555:1209-1994(-)
MAPSARARISASSPRGWRGPPCRWSSRTSKPVPSRWSLPSTACPWAAAARSPWAATSASPAAAPRRGSQRSILASSQEPAAPSGYRGSSVRIPASTSCARACRCPPRRRPRSASTTLSSMETTPHLSRQPWILPARRSAPTSAPAASAPSPPRPLQRTSSRLSARSTRSSARASWHPRRSSLASRRPQTARSTRAWASRVRSSASCSWATRPELCSTCSSRSASAPRCRGSQRSPVLWTASASSGQGSWAAGSRCAAQRLG